MEDHYFVYKGGGGDVNLIQIDFLRLILDAGISQLEQLNQVRFFQFV